MDRVLVRKATGDIEPYDEAKVRKSISRVGIPDNMQDEIVSQIQKSLRPEISTREIYQHILDFLKTHHPQVAGKYNLKQALMELGPTGYPFEQYIAAVLTQDGYETQTQQHLLGTCVMHEVDVLAIKGDQKIMIECKFHNQWGTRSDIKVTLYVKARFEDLKNSQNINQGWLVTNTKCTSDALAYADCVGLKVFSWNRDLPQLIETTKQYPVTCLTSISLREKASFISHNIILARELSKLSKTKFVKIGIPEYRVDKIQSEAKSLMSDHTQ